MNHDNSRIALVLGANGGIGGETAAALSRRGWTVRALVRNPAKAQPRAGWQYVVGDAMDRAAVVQAAFGARIIVHAVNPPGYRNWSKLVLPMIDNTISAAQASGARVLLPGTIYNYGLDAFPLLSEDAEQRSTTRKGRIRVEMEARLEAAAAHGVSSLILRAGDYFGPAVGNNWFGQGVVKPGKPITGITYPGKCGVGHAWAYLPDVGETLAQLAGRDQELPAFARFHFDGHWDPDGRQMTSAIRRVVGVHDLPVRPFPWMLLSAIAPFNETMRELIEMKPLWRHPARLDNRRLVAFLGTEPHTPLDQAIAATLQGLGVTPPVRRGQAPLDRTTSR